MDTGVSGLAGPWVGFHICTQILAQTHTHTYQWQDYGSVLIKKLTHPHGYRRSGLQEEEEEEEESQNQSLCVGPRTDLTNKSRAACCC